MAFYFSADSIENTLLYPSFIFWKGPLNYDKVGPFFFYLNFSLQMYNFTQFKSSVFVFF